MSFTVQALCVEIPDPIGTMLANNDFGVRQPQGSLVCCNCCFPSWFVHSE